MDRGGSQSKSFLPSRPWRPHIRSHHPAQQANRPIGHWLARGRQAVHPASFHWAPFADRTANPPRMSDACHRSRLFAGSRHISRKLPSPDAPSETHRQLLEPQLSSLGWMRQTMQLHSPPSRLPASRRHIIDIWVRRVSGGLGHWPEESGRSDRIQMHDEPEEHPVPPGAREVVARDHPPDVSNPACIHPPRQKPTTGAGQTEAEAQSREITSAAARSADRASAPSSLAGTASSRPRRTPSPR